MFRNRIARLGIITVVLTLIFTLSASTALAALDGSGSTGGVVYSDGTFNVVATGSSGILRPNLKVTVSNGSAGCMVGFYITKGTSTVYEGTMITGNNSHNCSLPAGSGSGTYTVHYTISGSAMISAKFVSK